MRRRSVLKRIGATGIGVAALAGSGVASSDGIDRVDGFDGQAVEIDGKVYTFKEGVSPDEVSLDGCPCCHGCNTRICDCCVICHEL